MSAATAFALQSNSVPCAFHGKTVRQTASDHFRLSELEYPALHRNSDHQHANPYFCMLLQGDYREEIGDVQFEYTPNSISYHPAAITHADNFGLDGGRVLIIEALESVSGEIGGIRLHFEQASASKEHHLAWLAQRIYQESRTADRYSILAIEGLLFEMMATLVRRSSQSASVCPDWLNKVTEFMREKYAGNISLEGLARVADVHPVYLSRVFRRFHGCSIREYLNELRVQFASRDLISGSYPLEEIAQSNGFYDQSHFTRVFKKFTGMTPGTFRSTQRQPFAN
jgi:AraC family transcriptional regulator